MTRRHVEHFSSCVIWWKSYWHGRESWKLRLLLYRTGNVKTQSKCIRPCIDAFKKKYINHNFAARYVLFYTGRIILSGWISTDKKFSVWGKFFLNSSFQHKKPTRSASSRICILVAIATKSGFFLLQEKGEEEPRCWVFVSFPMHLPLKVKVSNYILL